MNLSKRELAYLLAGAFALLASAPSTEAVATHAPRHRAHRPHHAVVAPVHAIAREGPGQLPAAPPPRPPHRHAALIPLRHGSWHRVGLKATGRHSPAVASAPAGTVTISFRRLERDGWLGIHDRDNTLPLGRGPPSLPLPRTNSRSFRWPHGPASLQKHLGISLVPRSVVPHSPQERILKRSRAAVGEGTAACRIPSLQGRVA